MLTPTPISSAVSHVSVHASAQSLRITNQKSLSHARLGLLSPSQSFVAGLRGMWPSAGNKVCIRAVMIQGLLGWFFFIPHQPIRALTEPLLWQEAGQILLWQSGSSSGVVEMAVNLPCSFTALCCLALWSFTGTSGGKNGNNCCFPCGLRSVSAAR